MCHYPLLRLLCKVILRVMKHLCFYSLQWNSNVTLGILLHSRSRLGTWEFQILERLFGRSGQTLSSEHARAIVLVNVQSIWLTTHNIHESRLVAIPM